MVSRGRGPSGALQDALDTLLNPDMSHPYLVQYFFARTVCVTQQMLQEMVLPVHEGGLSRTGLPWTPSVGGLMDMPSGVDSLDVHSEILDISHHSRSMVAGGSAAATIMDRLQPQPGDHLVLLASELCMLGDIRRAVSGQCFAACARWSAHLAERAAVCTMREVALGMLHLHGAGRAHSNLCPSNVLLMESHMDRRGFIAKVADAGLSVRRRQPCAAAAPAAAASAAHSRAASSFREASSLACAPAAPPPVSPSCEASAAASSPTVLAACEASFAHGVFAKGAAAQGSRQRPSTLPCRTMFLLGENQQHQALQAPQHAAFSRTEERAATAERLSPPVRSSMGSGRAGGAGGGGGEHYTAPELLLCDAPGCRSLAELQAADVYSFGALLYELTTGEVPHRMLTRQQLQAAAASGALELRWPLGVNPYLQLLSSRCMALDPAARPPFRVVVAELNAIDTRLRGSKPASGAAAGAAGAPAGQEQQQQRRQPQPSQQPSPQPQQDKSCGAQAAATPAPARRMALSAPTVHGRATSPTPAHAMDPAASVSAPNQHAQAAGLPPSAPPQQPSSAEPWAPAALRAGGQGHRIPATATAVAPHACVVGGRGQQAGPAAGPGGAKPLPWYAAPQLDCALYAKLGLSDLEVVMLGDSVGAHRPLAAAPAAPVACPQAPHLACAAPAGPEQRGGGGGGGRGRGGAGGGAALVSAALPPLPPRISADGLLFL